MAVDNHIYIDYSDSKSYAGKKALIHFKGYTSYLIDKLLKTGDIVDTGDIYNDPAEWPFVRAVKKNKNFFHKQRHKTP